MSRTSDRAFDSSKYRMLVRTRTKRKCKQLTGKHLGKSGFQFLSPIQPHLSLEIQHTWWYIRVNSGLSAHLRRLLGPKTILNKPLGLF